MRFQKQGFTFVELIVVLVIIAILSTIGFTVYESYISTGRDTKRIVGMKEVQTSLQEYSLQGLLPFPDSKISLLASGSVYAYQGQLTDSVMKQMAFKGSVYDSQYDTYPIYVLGVNQKDFELLVYLEDGANLNTAYVPSVQAAPQYNTLFPKIFGKPLGAVVFSESLIPINDVYTGSYDVINGIEDIKVYFSDTNSLDSQEDDLMQVLPQNSCKRILEMGYSKGSGMYSISPTGASKTQVYCDMEIDGGGWTFISYIDTYNTATNLFMTNTGGYTPERVDKNLSNTNTSYSIDARNLLHTEMMVSIDNKDPVMAAGQNKLIFYKYDIGNIGFYQGPFPCTGWLDKPSYKIGLSGSYQSSTAIVCSATEWRASSNMVSIYSGRGLYWYSGMGGDNSGYHSGWIYTR